ncbi:uncharacterized protein PAE49_005805 [Odontesthes bonariensis]|uniref:uncharacterized protein LOC142380232 n=1 Tax=Odontesthes bonariensis TaxID=219752 RepID=UPI003F58BABA
MKSTPMTPNGKSLYCALLVALIGSPALGTTLQISWTGGVTAGSRTTFTCSSSCFPNCVYTWNFRGRTYNGSTLAWTPDGLDDTEELQCIVFNPRTGLYTRTTTIVKINNPLSVQISPPNTVPSLNQSLNLVCHNAANGDPRGPPEVVWYKDGQRVTLRENMQLLRNNLTLHFDSLLPSDAAFYHCNTDVPTLDTSVFSLGYLLSFVPWNVSISGPDAVFPGNLSQFTCLTSCTLNVECTVRWEFRGGFPIGTFFSVNANKLRWTPSIPGTFQNFTCIAENKAAGRSAEATIKVEVKGLLASGSDAVQLSRLFPLGLAVGLWIVHSLPIKY